MTDSEKAAPGRAASQTSQIDTAAAPQQILRTIPPFKLIRDVARPILACLLRHELARAA